jgi:hypothetical protein
VKPGPGVTKLENPNVKEKNNSVADSTIRNHVCRRAKSKRAQETSL